jgi:hypothetical protein
MKAPAGFNKALLIVLGFFALAIIVGLLAGVVARKKSQAPPVSQEPYVLTPEDESLRLYEESRARAFEEISLELENR